MAQAEDAASPLPAALIEPVPAGVHADTASSAPYDPGSPRARG
ncbi:hypothetical protein SUDANB105_07008 [Streptomyces sp. enrichment culture]